MTNRTATGVRNRSLFSLLLAAAAAVLPMSLPAAEPAAISLDFTKLSRRPDNWQPTAIEAESARVSSQAWAFLISQEPAADAELSVQFTIEEAAKDFGFFGQSWSVWPDRQWADQGFEVGLLLRSSDETGYRVQLSHKYQEISLVKFPDGGYVQSVPCPVKLNERQSIAARVRGNRIEVSVDGQPRIDYVDAIRPLASGRWAIGVNSRAKVLFQDAKWRRWETATPTATKPSHQPQFAVRTWLGGRPWVFDGREPILLLPTPEERSINNAKLRPGFKPLLSWNSHWGIENQGAFPDGENRNSPIQISGGGQSLKATWTAKQVKDRFHTQTSLTVGFDPDRQVYTYDIDSSLEVGAEPFHFRYGYDFEHHTPLDPFAWQHLVVRRRDERLSRRPLSPFDPGPMEDIEMYHGLRLWFGRTRDDLLVCPVVEYHIDPAWNQANRDGKLQPRRCNTAVCAAFYDTGVSYEPETAAAGTKIRVKYRYTGYPADEAQRVFAAANPDDNPRNDPQHHFIFAGDQWPRIGFAKHLPMDQPWWGGRPFMSGHNARPSYDLVPTPGIGDGWSMRLGPRGYAVASLAAPSPLPAGRYVVSAKVKSVNTHGPGGRIEVLATDGGSENGDVRFGLKVLGEDTHFVGNGSFDWQTISFATAVPSGVKAIALGLGNAGTGEFFVGEVNFRRLDDGEPLPAGVLPEPRRRPPAAEPIAANGPLWDFRMGEQSGQFVYNYGSNEFRVLELANLDWTVDEGRPTLRFGENSKTRQDYPKLGILDQNVRHPVYRTSYEPVKHMPVAIAGHHGGGSEIRELTIVSDIKPAAEMGRDNRSGVGDVCGVGARRFILSLHGQQAPYKLAARLNVNDRFVTEQPLIPADRWSQVALTCREDGGRWQVRLFLDSKQVLEGRSATFAAPTNIPPSVILGAELFYLHDAYYRGLIGRTRIYARALSAEELAKLAAK